MPYNPPLRLECVRCGEWFLTSRRKKFCGPACRSEAMRERQTGESNTNWNPDATSIYTGRNRGRARYETGACEECGAAKTERHHKDGDPLNNEPENITILCRRCHMIADGRMEKWVALGESRSKTKQESPRPWRA
jgi:hypothetical protein